MSRLRTASSVETIFWGEMGNHEESNQFEVFRFWASKSGSFMGIRNFSAPRIGARMPYPAHLAP